MGNFFERFFREKDDNTITKIAMALGLGIVLLLSSTLFFSGGEAIIPEQPEDVGAFLTAPAPAARAGPEIFQHDFVREHTNFLETRLEEIFQTVAGAGEVKVMLTLSQGREVIIAENTVMTEERRTETDAGGIRREQQDNSYQGNKIIITDRDGTQRPLVLKEVEPRVEGVIIVAQGGGDVIVRDALIRAAQAVLGVEIHRVQVLRMN